MKALLIIFGIYMLALSVMPCSDAVNECQRTTSNSSSSELVESHNHQNDSNDFCSLFCTCNCCSIAAHSKIAASYTKNERLPLFSFIKFPIRSSFLLSNYYGNIWQPPKVSA
ncbi:DUF6660 family protein [Pedobacter endophyticus]|uniref:DUF6660 family protein n=1 Tax=Pedobacter endophyticus TaxID=2789740 RepID=UPI0037449EE1